MDRVMKDDVVGGLESLVEAHRGRLLIESTVDYDTKVTIELPRASDRVVA